MRRSKDIPKEEPTLGPCCPQLKRAFNGLGSVVEVNPALQMAVSSTGLMGHTRSSQGSDLQVSVACPGLQDQVKDASGTQG